MSMIDLELEDTASQMPVGEESGGRTLHCDALFE
jgi:hypothetical protein